MDKIIVHIDLNCFFVQCEIREHPELAGKPVAIGHEGKRGVISTSSYEARALGVFSGMPVSTARAKSKDLILVPGHYSLYQRYSKNFFSFLKKFCHYRVLRHFFFVAPGKDATKRKIY